MTVAAPHRPQTTGKPAITRDAKHRYTHLGIVYPGVTSLIKVLDKSDALMAWAARNTAEAALAQVDAIPGMLTTSGHEATIRFLTARSGWKRDEAAAIGSDIHRLADVIAKSEDLPDMAPGIHRRVELYAEWWASSGWTVWLSEAYLVNVTLGYGGTLDLLARDADGKTVLADVKTGKNIYPETRLQLAAYAGAEWVAPPESPTAYRMPAIDRTVVLHVTEDGVEVVEYQLDDADDAAFAACIPLSAWRAAQKGGRSNA